LKCSSDKHFRDLIVHLASITSLPENPKKYQLPFYLVEKEMFGHEF